MTTTDAGRTAGRIPDLRYQQPEDDLRAAVLLHGERVEGLP